MFSEFRESSGRSSSSSGCCSGGSRNQGEGLTDAEAEGEGEGNDGEAGPTAASVYGAQGRGTRHAAVEWAYFLLSAPLHRLVALPSHSPEFVHA